MADIELVIKIPENAYKATCNGNMLPPDVKNVVQGIKNGTPLPEHHGRLIDADELSVALDKMAYMDSQPRAIRRCIRRIKEEPTIIQASESEG